MHVEETSGAKLDEAAVVVAGGRGLHRRPLDTSRSAGVSERVELHGVGDEGDEPCVVMVRLPADRKLAALLRAASREIARLEAMNVVLMQRVEVAVGMATRNRPLPEGRTE